MRDLLASDLSHNPLCFAKAKQELSRETGLELQVFVGAE